MAYASARNASCIGAMCLYRFRCCCCKLPCWCLATTLYVALTPVVYVLVHFCMYPGIRIPAPAQFSKVCPACVEFEFPSARGGTIPALRYSPNASLADAAGRRAAPVLLLGGGGENMYTSMAFMIDLLPYDAPWDMYSISYPQYPPRQGGWLREGETVEDVRELLAFIRQQTGESSVVLGWSLGAAVAAAASVASPDDTRCVVLGNPFTNMWFQGMLVSHGLLAPWVYVADMWRTEDRVGYLQKPTIVLSSTDDALIPASMHTAVYTAVAARQKLLVEKTAYHMGARAFAGHNESLARALRSWCIEESATFLYE